MSAIDKNRINSVEKYEICKERMLKAFIKSYSKNNDEKKAYNKGKEAIKRNIKNLNLNFRKQIIGLYGELNYFYRCFKEQQLSAEMAIGYKGDFRGLINERPAIIDVTTNPVYKDINLFEEVDGELINGWDYYVGVVDIKNEESLIHPLLLPYCSDGELGYFILIFETTDINMYNLWGENSDCQYIIRYNPNSGGDEMDAIDEILFSYDYILGKPSKIERYIRDQYDLSEPFDKEIEENIQSEYIDYLNRLVYDFKKESGLMISALVELSEHWWNKDDFDLETKIFWSHPHKFIRSKIGIEDEILDYNIANWVSLKGR